MAERLLAPWRTAAGEGLRLEAVHLDRAGTGPSGRPAGWCSSATTPASGDLERGPLRRPRSGGRRRRSRLRDLRCRPARRHRARPQHRPAAPIQPAVGADPSARRRRDAHALDPPAPITAVPTQAWSSSTNPCRAAPRSCRGLQPGDQQRRSTRTPTRRPPHRRSRNDRGRPRTRPRARRLNPGHHLYRENARTKTHVRNTCMTTRGIVRAGNTDRRAVRPRRPAGCGPRTRPRARR